MTSVIPQNEQERTLSASLTALIASDNNHLQPLNEFKSPPATRRVRL